MARTKDASSSRMELLANVAEMYYQKEMGQAEIADQLQVSRSMVSHLLDDARRLRIVEFKINRPIATDRGLGAKLVEEFGLEEACVLVTRSSDQHVSTQDLGTAAARLLAGLLVPDTVLGLSWGTAMSAMVHAFEAPSPLPVKVVQLVGAIGARHQEYYDGVVLVQRMAQLLGGEAFYLNAPFFVDSPQTAQALRDHQTIRETLEMARRCTVAVTGIGTTAPPKQSSLYLSGHVTIEELEQLHASGAVGDVCGHYFEIGGDICNLDFSARAVAIGREDLLSIPIRIGVAGGTDKAAAIHGALLAGYLTMLVTDQRAAEAVLRHEARAP